MVMATAAPVDTAAAFVAAPKPMLDASDAELLSRYARQRDESAFSELVRRHVHLVHAAAARQSGGDAHLADDVTQAVFIVLARRAGDVAIDRLPAWLLTTARLCAKDAVRRRIRREQHEQRAASMRPTAIESAPDAALHEISPHLDHALCQLRPRDRTAVALRFLENRSMADVGVALGLSPNATQKVVSRALGKLRRMLAGRGVMLSSTAVLSAAMLESAAHAAPAAVLGQIVPVALAPAGAAAIATTAGAATTATASQLLAEGAIRATIAAAKLRTIVTIASVAAVVTGVAGGAAAIMSARRTPASPVVVVAPATAPDAAAVGDGAIVWHTYGQPLHEYAKPYPTLDPIMSKLIYEGRAADVAALLDEAPWLIEARTPRQQGGFTPLLVAARAGNVEIVNLLIRRGAYIEAENLWIGYTAINDAAYRGDPAVVKALLDVGADVNHRARRGLTALGLYYYAFDRGLSTVTPEQGARSEQMLIAAGSVYPQQRLKDRQDAAAKRAAATQTAATSTSPASSRPTTAKIDLGPVQRNQRGPEPSPRANAADGMLPGGGSLAATFQANKARVVFEPPNSAAPTVRLFYTDREFVRWAEQDLLVARFRLLREPDLAATLGVTSGQMRRLTSLPPPPPRGMLASPADVAELQRLWSACRAAAEPRKATTSRQIAESLARIADAARERTQAAYMTRAREVEAILTPEQIEAYREMRIESTSP
jgi:RNA polymerase sigma factor (sigma-70 family)